MYDNNDYMYAIERNDDYLAHFGVKGMRWGVRKAREAGNSRKLGRMYKKAARKLAKLEKRANNGKKYARRAALLGAGAAAAGGLAAAGTRGVGIGVANLSAHAARASRGAGKVISGAGKTIGNLANAIPGKQLGLAKAAGKVGALGTRLTNAGAIGKNAGGIVRRGADVSKKILDWGNSSSISKAAGRAIGNTSRPDFVNTMLTRTTGTNLAGYGEKLKRSGITNNTIARIGAGAIGAGLAAGAGYNAYRAATTKRAARKAAQWRSEMNRAFKGTQYANGGGNRQGGKKRRRNRG